MCILFCLDNIERIEKLRKMFGGMEMPHILAYVKNNPGTTIDKVAKYLQEEKVCSRLTTLKVIDELLSMGVLIDKRKGRYFHSLYFNKDWDFTELEIKLLTGAINDIKDFYGRLLPKNEKIEELFDKYSIIANSLNKQNIDSQTKFKKLKGWLDEKTKELDEELGQK
jgi:hypothetical protein